MYTSQETDATVELVWGQPSLRVAHEIAGFWLLSGAMSNPLEIQRRIQEVLLVLRNPQGALIAVTSIYPYPVSTPGSYIGLRAFVEPSWRSMPLLLLMFDSMVASLKERAVEPTGLMFCSENRKLMQPGNRRWFERRGWRRISPDSAERDEWLMMIGPGNAHPVRA